MEIIKIIIIGLLCVFISSIFKEYKKEYVTFVSIIGGIIILIYSMDKLKDIVNLINDFSNKVEYSNYVRILLKITGIAILTEYAVSICKDAGENAIANKIDYSGKILIVSLSLPIITTTMESFLKIIP